MYGVLGQGLLCINNIHPCHRSIYLCAREVFFVKIIFLFFSRSLQEVSSKNHVSFPEFQQNGSTKHFVNGKNATAADC